MPTRTEDKAFGVDLVDPDSLLDKAIEWIVNHLTPDQVFCEQELRDWAEANGYEEPE